MNHVQAELSEAHRGGFTWHAPDDVGIIFENRASNKIWKRQFAFIRKLCELEGSEIYGIATAEDGSWVILLHYFSFDVEDLHSWAWAAWHSACAEVIPELTPLTPENFFNNGDFPLTMTDWSQYDIAQKTIVAHYSNPNRWKNCKSDLFRKPSS